MRSPTASNAPARDDTHPAAWNVSVGSESLTDSGAQTLDDAPESARKGRTHRLRRVLDDALFTCLRARCHRPRTGCAGDGSQGRLSARKE